MGRIQPVGLWRPCVMRVRGPNNVGRAVKKSCANGSNIVALRRKAISEQQEMLGVIGSNV